MNRSLLAIAAVIVLAAVIVFLVGRSSPATPNPAPSNPTPPPTATSPTPPSPPQTTPVSINVPPLTLEGVVDLGPQAPADRVAVRIGGMTVADVPVENDRYRVTLPGTLKNVPLRSLDTVVLPNGEGRLRGQDALGSGVTFLGYQDQNGNGQLDQNEPNAEATPFKATLEAGMRGFFRHRAILISAPAALEETQDSDTGAKGYYRYKLKLQPGWHMIEGEFGSNGYDIREATGTKWDLLQPFKPNTGPSGFER